jgi:membrane-bound metal-dependent hydrolase YbcI (DUF457 family)
MLAHEHALSGAAAFAACAPYLAVTSAPGVLAGVVFTAGAATLPDIDEPGSVISDTLGFWTEALSWVVHRVSGGHRKGTHSGLGEAFFTAVTWLAVTIATWKPGQHVAGLTLPAAHYAAVTLGGKIVLAGIIGTLLAAAVRALNIGSHHGDLIGLAAGAAAVHWDTGLAVVPACVALGAAAHIAGDELTHSGCPLLWPVSGHEFHLLPEPLRFTTGSFTERWVVAIALSGLLGWLLWRVPGISGPAQTAWAHLTGGVQHL